MTIEELVKALENLSGGEEDHMEADDLLLTFIDNPEVTRAFERIDKWYA